MSARHIRRIKEELEQQDSLSDISSEEDVSTAPSRPAFTAFSSSEEEESSSSEEELDTTEPAPPAAQPTIKQQKQKQKARQKDEDAMLDAVIASVKEAAALQGNPSIEDFKLFAVDTKFLNAEKEMQRIYGIRADANAAAPPINPRNARARRRVLKKTRFVTLPADGRVPPPFAAGGIRLSPTTRPDDWNEISDFGAQFFKIEWSSTYLEAQSAFVRAQLTHDPNQIALTLRRYPNHIDSNLQLSRYCEHHGQMDEATSLLKVAIITFEYAFTEKFTFWDGNSRVDIRVSENAALFDSFVRHLKGTSRRGCHQTAFQVAKFVWSLDPYGDPMYLLLLLDYYALSSRSYEFILQLFEEDLKIGVDRRSSGDDDDNTTTIVSHNNSIKSLPSYWYSSALALYWIGNRRQDALERLKKALVSFPTVLPLLLETIGGVSWASTVLEQQPFNVRTTSSAVYNHLISLFVERNASLWNDKGVLELLQEAANSVIESNSSSSDIDFSASGTKGLQKYLKLSVADMLDEPMRLPPDDPLMAPAQLNQRDALLAAAAENGLNEEQVAEAMLAAQQLRQDQNNNNNDDGQEQLDLEANPLLLFLQSLLPWNTLPNNE